LKKGQFFSFEKFKNLFHNEGKGKRLCEFNNGRTKVLITERPDMKNHPQLTASMKNQPQLTASMKNQTHLTASIKNQPQLTASIKNQPQLTDSI